MVAISEYNIDIGKRIYTRRKEKGMSREQMLEYVNISEVYLGMIERGKRGTSIEHLVQIADALGMSMDFLILGKEKDFDKNDSLSKKAVALGVNEKKLVEKIIERLRLNLVNENHLKTVSDIVEYYVQYEKNSKLVEKE